MTADREDLQTVSAPMESDRDRRGRWSRRLVFGVIAAVVLLLGAGAGVLKWQQNSERTADRVRDETTQFARDATQRLLSYEPATVEKELNSARSLLTGEFLDSYTRLINDVVIPGALEKQITTVAEVPAVASVSARADKAVALVFVNQTISVGEPTGPSRSTCASNG